jgi:hypothetical protein
VENEAPGILGKVDPFAGDRTDPNPAATRSFDEDQSGANIQSSRTIKRAEHSFEPNTIPERRSYWESAQL